MNSLPKALQGVSQTRQIVLIDLVESVKVYSLAFGKGIIFVCLYHNPELGPQGLFQQFLHQILILCLDQTHHLPCNPFLPPSTRSTGL